MSRFAIGDTFVPYEQTSNTRKLRECMIKLRLEAEKRETEEREGEKREGEKREASSR